MKPEPPEYGPVVEALTPVLHNLPGKLVAISGRPCAGKTTLGRFLAWRFNVSLIETDLFMIEGRGKPVYRNDQVAPIIAKRIDRRSPRPLIIEGTVVLRLLHELGREPDFVILVTNQDAPESSPDFEADLASYDTEFRPQERADITVALRKP